MKSMIKSKGLSLVVALMMVMVIIMGVATGVFAAGNTETQAQANTTKEIQQLEEQTPEIPEETEKKEMNNDTEVKTKKEVSDLNTEQNNEKTEEEKEEIKAEDSEQEISAFADIMPMEEATTIEIPNGDTLVFEDENNFYFSSDPEGSRGLYGADTEIKGAWIGASGVSTVEVKGNVNVKKLSGYNLTIKGGGTINVKDNSSQTYGSDAVLAAKLHITGNISINLNETKTGRASDVTDLVIDSGSSFYINSQKSTGFIGSTALIKGSFKVDTNNYIGITLTEKLTVDGGTVEANSGTRTALEVTGGTYKESVELLVKNKGKVIVRGSSASNESALHTSNIKMESGGLIQADGYVAINNKFNVNIKDSTLKLNTASSIYTKYGINIQGNSFKVNNSTVQIGQSGSFNSPEVGIETNGDIKTVFENNSKLEITANKYGISDGRDNVEIVYDNSNINVNSFGDYGIVLYRATQTFTARNGAKVNLSGKMIGMYLTDGNVHVNDNGTELNVTATHQTYERVWGMYISGDTDWLRGNVFVNGGKLTGRADHWAGLYAAGEMQVNNGGFVDGQTANEGVGIHTLWYLTAHGEGSRIYGMSPKGTGIRVQNGYVGAYNGGVIEGTTKSANLNGETKTATQRGLEIWSSLYIDKGTIIGNAIDFKGDSAAVSVDGEIRVREGQLVENYQQSLQLSDEDVKVPFENVKTITNFASYDYTLDKGKVEITEAGLKPILRATGAKLTASRNVEVDGEKVVLDTGGSHVINTAPVELITKELVKYTVTFDGNGANVQAEPNTLLAIEPEFKLTQLPENPKREGFEFIGWNTQQDGNGQAFDLESEVSTDITVYAQWKEEEITPVDPVEPEKPVEPENPTPEQENPNPAPQDPVQDAEPTTAVPAPTIENELYQARENNEQPQEQGNEQALQQIVEEGVPTMNIGDQEVPLHGGSNKEVWALVNLILAIVGLVLSAAVIISIVRKNKKEQESQNSFEWLSVIVSLMGIVVFFITENMSKVMVLVDKWTLLSVALILVQIGILAFAKFYKKHDQDTNGLTKTN